MTIKFTHHFYTTFKHMTYCNQTNMTKTKNRKYEVVLRTNDKTIVDFLRISSLTIFEHSTPFSTLIYDEIKKRRERTV